MDLKLMIFLYGPNALPSTIREEIDNFLRGRTFPGQPQVIFDSDNYREVWIWYYDKSGQPPQEKSSPGENERS